jgi:hypothetical protein
MIDQVTSSGRSFSSVQRRAHYGGAALSCTAARGCRIATFDRACVVDRLRIHGSPIGAPLAPASCAPPTPPTTPHDPKRPIAVQRGGRRAPQTARGRSHARRPLASQAQSLQARARQRSIAAARGMVASPPSHALALAAGAPVGLDPSGMINIAIWVFAQRRHQR